MTAGWLRCAGVTLAALLASGCAGPQDSAAERGVVTRSTSRVAPGQTGLEVARWEVADSDERLEKALRAHTAASAAAMDEVALRQNGFLLWPVKRAELEAMLDEMGGSSMDVRTWFGQLTAWREVAAAQVGTALLEVDGAARERHGAVVRMMLRSWPLPMEDGTRIAVELVPQVVQNAAEASLLKNGERLAGQVLATCAVELELDRDVAWVITCDPTRHTQMRLPDDAPAGDAAPAAAAPAEGDAAASGEPQPQSSSPPAAPPTEPAPPAEPGAEPAAEPAPPPAAQPTPAPQQPAPAQPTPAPQPAPAPALPPLQPAPAPQPVQPHQRPPEAPPLQSPDPPAKRPSPKPAAHALLAMLLAAQDQQASEKPTLQVETAGTLLLLASPAHGDIPARRTVMVLIPHLDASPFPAGQTAQPMTPASAP